VAGIVNLVSAAVEGLRPERVSVVDTRGNVLADGSGQGRDSLRLTATQLDIKRATERAIRADVESMLDRVAGPGKAVVRVSARMSFDQKQTTSEIFEPAAGGTQGVVASQERTREVYGPGARGAGGIPGTASNVQPPLQRPAAPPAGGQPGYERQQESTRFNVSRRTETVEGAPGQLEQLSVAVMVDREVGPEKLAAIRQAASAAAGIDPARGDRIVVESVEFPKEEAAGKAPLAASLGRYLNIGRNALAILLLAGFALFIRGALAKQNITVENLRPVLAELGPGGQAPPALEQASAAQPAGLQKTEMPELTIPLESAKELARQQPQEIANVVRTWMSDERRAA
jgi:flagellar M-ring protein FliF